MTGATGINEHPRCVHCDEVTGGYGHLTKDSTGWFLRCEDPERYERKRAHDRVDHEVRERVELRRLAAKYPDELTRS